MARTSLFPSVSVKRCLVPKHVATRKGNPVVLSAGTMRLLLYSCQPCPVCSKEHGLTVPCGSTVNDKKLVACQSPTLGKTFINHQGIIQPCTICSPGQEVTTNCSSKVDSLCGGCKQGFYYNYHSKSCQECFWCCNYIDSENVMKCIRETMLSAREPAFLRSQFLLPLQVYTQSSHSYHEYFRLRLLNFDVLTCTLTLTVIAFFFFYFQFHFPKKKGFWK